MTVVEDLKARVCAEVDARAEQLIGIARQIHARPEIGHQEFFAHDLLADALDGAGLAPERKAYDLPTAFAARSGDAGPLVAVLCEYDALPELGHACGHNVIAAIGLGAGLAAAAVAAEAGGRLLVLGTPSEERPPLGKDLLLAAGAFEDVDAAMMVHPAGTDLRSIDGLAAVGYDVEYRGLAAHAAAAPEHGRNALDAAVLGYTAVAALRQHILPTERIHGIFLEGGSVANVVPDHVVARWAIRSPTAGQLAELEQRVIACLRSGAVAAGCEVEFHELGRTWDVRTNPILIDHYTRNMATLGRPLHDPAVIGGVVGSTDMGAVSYAVPSIHPMIKLAPTNCSIHDPIFTDYTGSPDADAAVIDGAKALAMTVVDLWADPVVLPAVRTAFTGSLSPHEADAPDLVGTTRAEV